MLVPGEKQRYTAYCIPGWVEGTVYSEEGQDELDGCKDRLQSKQTLKDWLEWLQRQTEKWDRARQVAGKTDH